MTNDEGFKDEDEINNDNEEEEDSEGPSPEELREKRYPLAPAYRISDGKIDRLSLWRVLQTGKLLLITSQACPVKTTWAEVKRICGGGTYTVKGVAANNQFLGSQTETQTGRPKAPEQIVWPDSLIEGGGVSETAESEPRPADGESPATDVIVDRRAREQREWEARMAREEREWKEAQDARRVREEAAARQSQQEHEMRMKKLELEISKATMESDSKSKVELKKAEGDIEIRKTQLEIDRKNRSQADVVDRLVTFGEKFGEKMLEKNPEAMAKIVDAVSGSKLDENAKIAVKEQFLHLREDLAGNVAEAAVEETIKRVDGEKLYAAMARSILSDPEASKKFLALLQDVAAEK